MGQIKNSTVVQANENVAVILAEVRDAAESNGGLSLIAKRTGLARESLYRALSSTGNPTIKTLCSTLNAIGMQLKITPITENMDVTKK